MKRYYCQKYKEDVNVKKAFSYCLKSHKENDARSEYGCPYLQTRVHKPMRNRHGI